MVYVDDMNTPFRRMIMNHMMADTSKELKDMARKIGVNLKWIQYPNTSKEHFDICLRMKKKAIALGAKEVTWKWIGELTTYRVENEIIV